MGFNWRGAAAGLLGEVGNQANKAADRLAILEDRRLQAEIQDRRDEAMFTRQKYLAENNYQLKEKYDDSGFVDPATGKAISKNELSSLSEAEKSKLISSKDYENFTAEEKARIASDLEAELTMSEAQTKKRAILNKETAATTREGLQLEQEMTTAEENRKDTQEAERLGITLAEYRKTKSEKDLYGAGGKTGITGEKRLSIINQARKDFDEDIEKNENAVFEDWFKEKRPEAYTALVGKEFAGGQKVDDLITLALGNALKSNDPKANVDSIIEGLPEELKGKAIEILRKFKGKTTGEKGGSKLVSGLKSGDIDTSVNVGEVIGKLGGKGARAVTKTPENIDKLGNKLLDSYKGLWTLSEKGGQGIFDLVEWAYSGELEDRQKAYGLAR